MKLKEEILVIKIKVRLSLWSAIKLRIAGININKYNEAIKVAKKVVKHR